MPLFFITGNPGKFKDAQLVFGKNVERISIDLAEIQSMNPEEVIKHKVKELENNYLLCGRYLMIEDTSLFIDCLGGLPGTFVKFFVERLGPEGIYNQVNNMNSSTVATAVSCVGLYDLETNEKYFFKSEVKGNIVSPRGTGGFGWDSIFQPDGSKETYAEMDSDTRSVFNVRIKAMKNFQEIIKK